MDTKDIIPLIYLWTRDAGMPVSAETEDYVLDTLHKIRTVEKPTYSDVSRAHMAARIHNLMLNPVKDWERPAATF